MKIALLGPNGFVGQNLSEEFRINDIPFFPVSRRYGYDLREKEDNIRFIKESGCSIIINCCAHVGSLNYVTTKSADIISDNTRMILSLYESVKEVDRNIWIINPIANCAFPANATKYVETELWDGPLHPSVMAYGMTRRFMVVTADSYQKQYGIRTINLFTPNMYGPLDSTDPNKAHALNALVSKFVKAGQEPGSQVEIWGTGVAIREWLYARDFARIITSIVKKPLNGEFSKPVSVAQNFGLSIKELVDIIMKCFKYNGQVNWDSKMPDGAPKKVMDDTEFRKIFPDFEFTCMHKGIQETTNYYLSKYPY